MKAASFGASVAGLVAAGRRHPKHGVTVFEADESLERCVNTSGEDRVADQREPLSGLKGVLTRRAARRPAAVGLAP